MTSTALEPGSSEQLARRGMLRKYEAPSFRDGIVDQPTYERWLQRKAKAHVLRDRRRGNLSAAIAVYKAAIHEAVKSSEGRDCYTGEPLRWNLISTYSNEASQRGRRAYKAEFARLPTVDHVGDGLGDARFEICAWRANDAKNDLNHADFVSLCRMVVAHADRRDKKGQSE